MEIFISIVNLVNLLFQPIANIFLKTTVSVENPICEFNRSRISDGEGGFLFGSHGNFDLVVINRKNTSALIRNVYCTALCEGKLLKDRILCKTLHCRNSDLSNCACTNIQEISVSPKSSIRYAVTFSVGADLSLCDKFVLHYCDGLKNKRIVIWKK